MPFFPNQGHKLVRRMLIFFFSLLFMVPAAGAQERNIRFAGACLDKNGGFLSLMSCSMPFAKDYNALLSGQAGSREIDVLTIYPEKSYYFSGRDELLLENHFGRYSLVLDGGKWEREESSFSPFEQFSPAMGALEASFISPDGNYSVSLEPDDEDPGTQFLVFRDRTSREALILAEGFDMDTPRPQVLWSPDSRYFLYPFRGEVYYFSLSQYKTGRIPAMAFRRTGFKDMRCLRWTDEGALIFLDGEFVYKILGEELFALSFYKEPLHSEGIQFRLPLSFEPERDNFYPSPGGRKVFWVRKGRMGMLFSRRSGDACYEDFSLNISCGMTFQDVQWRDDSSFLMVLKNRSSSGNDRLLLYDESLGSGYQELVQGAIQRAVLSPDGRLCGVLTDKGLDILDLKTFRMVDSFPMEQGLNLFWSARGWICVGEKNTFLVSSGGGRRNLALSQVDFAGFSEKGDILASQRERLFRLTGEAFWEPAQDLTMEAGMQRSGDFRIVLDEVRRGCFDNLLLLKDAAQGKTWSPVPVPLLSGRSNGEGWSVDKGLSGKKDKALALVFNASADGGNCLQVLDILKAYRIKGTFFLSRRFIHAYPDEVKLLARGGHTVGSLSSRWLAQKNLSFQESCEFLEQELCRNEEDYHRLGGQDMSRIWHTLGYESNPMLPKVAENIAYGYVGSRLYPWESGTLSSLLSRIEPGDIIPFTLGSCRQQTQSPEEVLSLLIEALLKEGHRIVPLAELLEGEKN